MSVLEHLKNPAFLSGLGDDQLNHLAQEIRNYLIQALNQSGGHLASNLGVVELSIALHYVFNPAYDRLVWDVGHQTYVHKILTGRKNQLINMRQLGGSSGFLKRHESIYDCFGAGHSSTSIAGALGMQVASRLLDEQRHCVAIIGDAAMGAGMSFEALNHAGQLKDDFLIILNDNKMSIGMNVGALNQHLSSLLTQKNIQWFKRRSQEFLLQFSNLYSVLEKNKKQIKGLLHSKANVFEHLGLNYYGPVDGHDIKGMIGILENVKTISGPKILHVITQKGAGYQPAEKDPIAFHGVKKQFLHPPATPKEKACNMTFSQVLGAWVCQQARTDEKLAVLTPAMAEGSCLNAFAKQFPQRFFDVGIAEQHSLTFAAGLACEGMHPVLAIYSTFLQRGYDQLIHDVLLQKLPLILAIDRAGCVGEDGETHSGAYDIAFLRPLPNIVLCAPSNGSQLLDVLALARKHSGCFAIRFPKDDAGITDINTHVPTGIQMAQAQLVHQGNKIAVLNFGALLNKMQRYCVQNSMTLVDMCFIKPMDTKMLRHVLDTHDLVIIVEDGVLEGGAASGVLEWCMKHQYSGLKIRCIHLPFGGLPCGSRSSVLEHVDVPLKQLKTIVNDFKRSKIN